MADVRKKHDGAWLVRWRENGKQRYRQFRTEAEALEFKKTKERGDFDKMMDAAHGRRPGQYESAGDTWERDRRGTWKMVQQSPGKADEEGWSVAGYSRRLIESERDLSGSSRHTYLSAIRRYLEDTDLGRADVRYVTTDTIRDWWTTVPDGGRWDAQKLLSKVLNRAVLVGDRDDNPMRRAPEIRKPRRKRELDFDPLTADQIEELADAATRLAPGKGLPGELGEMTRQRDRLLILVMGYCGLRAGEAGGLRLQDMVRTPDGRCQLRIWQQVVRDAPKDPPRVAPLKTQSSRRTITVACSLWEELKEFAERFGAADDGRVFHGPNGEARDHTLINGMVKRAAGRVGMRDVHAHLLRHSAVSLLIHAGANPREIQEFVGHADVTMTLGTYGHLFDTSGSRLADIMESLREQHRNGR